MDRRDTLMILIAGPYRSGTKDDPAKMADHVRRMLAGMDRALRFC